MSIDHAARGIQRYIFRHINVYVNPLPHNVTWHCLPWPKEAIDHSTNGTHLVACPDTFPGFDHFNSVIVTLIYLSSAKPLVRATACNLKYSGPQASAMQ